MSPDPDEQFTFHYEILHGFRASSSTHSGHFGDDFLLWGMLVAMVVETDTGVYIKSNFCRGVENLTLGFPSLDYSTLRLV